VVASKARNLLQDETDIDDVTGLIVSAEYNTQTTLPGLPAMVMACMKPIASNYEMFVNPFAVNVVITTQIISWWYEGIGRIDPVQRNNGPPHANTSLVIESSQQLFSSQTLCI